MIAEHKAEVDELKGKVEEAYKEVMESSRIKHEQTKYDDRIKLIKKMNEEETSEIRRVNNLREQQLEQQIMQLHRDNERLYSKAKEEARNEEKRKRAKF